MSSTGESRFKENERNQQQTAEAFSIFTPRGSSEEDYSDSDHGLDEFALLDLFDANPNHTDLLQAADTAMLEAAATSFDEIAQVDLFKCLVNKMKLTPRGTPRSPLCPHVKRHRVITPRHL